MMEKYLEIQRRRAAGEVDGGFTLIELLIVIVVLGILAATVIFALGGVTGQSAVAACNSDAKSYQVAIAAYANSPSNTTNAEPTTTASLLSSFGTTFLQQASSNSAYTIALSGDSAISAPTTINGTAYNATTNAPQPGIVYIANGKVTTGGAWFSYDPVGSRTTNGCTAAGVS